MIRDLICAIYRDTVGSILRKEPPVLADIILHTNTEAAEGDYVGFWDIWAPTLGSISNTTVGGYRITALYQNSVNAAGTGYTELAASNATGAELLASGKSLYFGEDVVSFASADGAYNSGGSGFLYWNANPFTGLLAFDTDYTVDIR